MDYSLKTVSQLRPMLLGFRKQAGLTQEKVAQRLGISQQSYAAFEAHPESASVDRLFRVLRLFAVEMRLSCAASPASPAASATRGKPATSAVAPAGAAKRKASETRPAAAKARGAPASPPKRKAATPATRGAAAKKRAAPTAAPASAPTRPVKRASAPAAGKSTAPKPRAKPRKREDW